MTLQLLIKLVDGHSVYGKIGKHFIDRHLEDTLELKERQNPLRDLTQDQISLHLPLQADRILLHFLRHLIKRHGYSCQFIRTTQSTPHRQVSFSQSMTDINELPDPACKGVLKKEPYADSKNNQENVEGKCSSLCFSEGTIFYFSQTIINVEDPNARWLQLIGQGFEQNGINGRQMQAIP